MNEQLTRLIVDDLARQRDRSDIILMVCQEARLNWTQAEQLVQRVEAQQAHAIAGKQGPLLIFLGTVTTLGGLLLLLYSIRVLTEILRGDLLEQILSLGSSYYPLVAGWIGLTMVAGGVIGLYRAYLRYFET